jgi:plastocyanin
MRRGGLVIGALVAVLALTAGCGGGDEGGGGAAATTAAPETTATTGGGGEDELKLTAQGFKWDQTTLQLQAGSQVKVEVSNQDSATHSFTFEAAGADQEVAGGEDATVTFTAPDAGGYQFLCRFHPAAMTGTVTVT